MRTPLRACAVLFLLLPPPLAGAQSGASSARLSGRVSGAVAISAPAGETLSGRARATVASLDAATLAVSISSPNDEAARVNIPVRLRSNVGYSLDASFLSPGDLDVRLSVAGLRATGEFVHAGALEGVILGEALAAPQGERPQLRTVQNRALSIAILSGPPVSKAGTFNSPDNAIEVVLSVELQPKAEGEPWSAQLTITAAPGR